MPRSDIFDKSFDEATLMKLDLFEKYLEEWLGVYVSKFSSKKAYILDLFCGAGRDRDANEGSALRSIKVLLKWQKKYDLRNVTLVLCDAQVEKIESLESILEHDLSCQGNTFNIRLYCKTFPESFFQIEAEIKNAFNLIFLDPHGFNFITPEIFKKLCFLRYTDTIFFIASNFANRFVDNPPSEATFQEMGLEEDIMQEIKNSDHYEIHRIMAKHYRKLSHEFCHQDKQLEGVVDKIFLSPFSLKKEHTHNIYGLIFLTHDYCGIDKFLHLAWEKNPFNGEANFNIDRDYDPNRNDSQLRLFPIQKVPSNRLTALHAIIDRELSQREKISNKDLCILCYENGYYPQKANEYIEKLVKENRIVKEGNKRGKISYNSAIKGKSRATFYRIIK
ncbi:MAG: three-Cys-motif partner protein TcmP [Vampirovibrionia bacterium]|jgi:three-Cys-motif partner protein